MVVLLDNQQTRKITRLKKTISSSFVPLRFSYGGPSSAVGVHVKGLPQIETGGMYEDKI